MSSNLQPCPHASDGLQPAAPVDGTIREPQHLRPPVNTDVAWFRAFYLPAHMGAFTQPALWGPFWQPVQGSVPLTSQGGFTRDQTTSGQNHCRQLPLSIPRCNIPTQQALQPLDTDAQRQPDCGKRRKLDTADTTDGAGPADAADSAVDTTRRSGLRKCEQPTKFFALLTCEPVFENQVFESERALRTCIRLFELSSLRRLYDSQHGSHPCFECTQKYKGCRFLIRAARCKDGGGFKVINVSPQHTCREAPAKLTPKEIAQWFGNRGLSMHGKSAAQLRDAFLAEGGDPRVVSGSIFSGTAGEHEANAIIGSFLL
eukprot:m.26320 g.26320  ORF g.26320 m.26320 type:complete len:315 (-) comp9908_c0_seq3:728-1672(-)